MTSSTVSPRIVYFELPGYLRANYVEDEACPVWQALQVTVHTLGRDGATVTTERMSADDPRAAAFRGHPAIEHDVTAEYAFWVVGAAECADSFGTLSVRAQSDGCRLVAIRREYVDLQLTRYDGGAIALEAA